MIDEKISVKSYRSIHENKFEQELYHCLKECPIPESQMLENLGLFLTSKNFARILFMHHIYEQTLNVPGVIMDFGTRWGQNMSLFSIFRGMYEPFNRHRKIIGFDTFSGFPNISEKDGKSDLMSKGNVSVTKDYINFLEKIMDVHEKMNPISHIKKFELIAGDAIITISKYLDDNPHTIISLAYFDFDLYAPTKKVLESISDRLAKGSILGFDELNDPDSPGETLALMEVFGLNKISLRRLPIVSRSAYFVIE